MHGLGIEETTTTTGTGTLTLSAVSQRARVADWFGINDPVAYVLFSGNGDIEWGVGNAAAGNTLVRPTTIVASLVAGVVTTGGGPISISGISRVKCVEHFGGSATSVPAIRVPGAGVQSFNPALVMNTAGGSITLVANRLFAFPIKCPEYAKLNGLGVVVTSPVAGTAYLGIAESYVDTNGRMKPGRVLGMGSVNVGTTGVKTDTSSYVPVLLPGHQYWGLVESTSAAIIRAVSVSAALNQLGFASDGISPNQCLYVDYGSAPFGSDLSGTTFTLTSSLSGIPHMLLTS